jgi:hypothetical protein
MRQAITRRAKAIAALLGADWRYLVSVHAGGAAARVVFTNGTWRLVLEQDGRGCRMEAR